MMFSGCTRRTSIGQAPRVAVRVLKVQTKLLQKPVVVFGQTEAYQSSQLAFQVSGVVAKINVEEGDPVKDGFVLASLDKESVKINLKLSRARYYEAAVSYRKMKKGYRKEVVRQNYAAYRRAKAMYEKARIDYQSSLRLKKSDAISNEQFTRAKSNYETAKASMSQAKQAYQMYLRGYQKEDIQVAGVKTSQARAQLALAKKQLKDAELRAPFQGVIAQKNVSVGELVSSQRSAFVLMDLRKVRIRVGVPERVIEHISLGQKAFIMFKPRKIAAVGKLARKGVVIDKSTLTYPVEIEVDNPIVRKEDGKPVRKFLPGKVVIVAFPRQDSKKGISVPLDAVLHDGAKKYVYVNENNKAKQVLVETGNTFRNQIVIKKGLKDGAEVIIAGQHRLDAGRSLLVLDGGPSK